MTPVIVFMFFWAVIATGLFLRMLDIAEENESKAERELAFWRTKASLLSHTVAAHVQEARNWLDWFYRTKCAHGRRKRLQRITDRAIKRAASAEFDRAFLLGENDQLRTAVEREKETLRGALRYSTTVTEERDAALRAESDLRRD